jgi:hypothetical protein
MPNQSMKPSAPLQSNCNVIVTTSRRGVFLSRWMKWFFFLCLCVLITACSRSPDNKFVGDWQSDCSADVCTTTSLRADHTFSIKHDEKYSTASYSGTWRIEGDQLIGHVTAADEPLQEMIGKDFRVTIADFHGDTFRVILPYESSSSAIWKRIH